jgi:hypothetical protein
MAGKKEKQKNKKNQIKREKTAFEMLKCINVSEIMLSIIFESK